MDGPSAEVPTHARHTPEVWGYDRQTRKEISTIRTSIGNILEKEGVQTGKLVNLETLDGRSITVTAKQKEDPAHPATKRGILSRHLHRRPAVPDYILDLPATPTNQKRRITIGNGSLRAATLTPVPDQPIHDYELITGAELRQTVDEAEAILAQYTIATKGEDALIASEQLGPCETIRGQEARDLQEMLYPVMTKLIGYDPGTVALGTDESFRVMNKTVVLPKYAITGLYFLQSEHTPQRLDTRILFENNPFGEGRQFAMNVNTHYGSNGNIKNVTVSYFQSQEDEAFTDKPIALDPGERRQAAEAMQKQIIPNNLTRITPGRQQWE